MCLLARCAALVLALGVLLLAPMSVRDAAGADVSLYVSLVDANGEPITDLRPDQIIVMEDDQPRVTLLLEPITWPTRLTVLVDNTQALAGSLPKLREGLRAFFEALPERLEAELLTISPQPRTVVPLTTNHQELADAVSLIAPGVDVASRFVEGVEEAVDRFREDDGDYFPMILAVVADDLEISQFNDNRLARMQQHVVESSLTVHMILQQLGLDKAGLGDIQTQVGLALTKMTAGRYENIAAASSSRLKELLEEYARMIGQSHIRQSHSYRVVYHRPDDAPAVQQGISLRSSRTDVADARLSIDGRVPQP